MTMERTSTEKVIKFWEELTTVYCSQPEWRLPSRVIYENCSFTLRLFHEAEGPPVLIIPPNAGHHSCIAEKLIETCISVAPKASVYCMDWVPAKSCNESTSETISSMTNYVALASDIISKPVHLMGLCQGGWQATLYTALYPERVHSLVLAAAPIDFHAALDESKMQFWVNNLPMEFFAWMVQAGGGIQPGHLQLLGFKNLNPYDRYIGDYIELWQAIDDGNEKAVSRWRRNHVWYDNPQSLSGTWYLEVVDKLFKQNLLVKKKLEVCGQIVDLSKITCPVFLLIGEEDDITHQKELFALEKYVSSKKVEKYVVPKCGHIGIFLKDEALSYWRKIVQEVWQDPTEKLLQDLKL